MTENEVTLPLIIRRCNDCKHEAIPLEGIGTECVECETGEYVERTGTRVVEITAETAEGMRKENPEAIAE